MFLILVVQYDMSIGAETDIGFVARYEDNMSELAILLELTW